MGKTFDSMTDELQDWLMQQKMIVVATAPLAASGLINCSPKGGDTFRIVSPREVAYQDLTGSGIETVAHLRENGRIVLMFCAYAGAPKIVRLYGRGEVIEPGDPEFAALAMRFPENAGMRSIIRIALERIADSCGFAVPLYEFLSPRDVLDKWSAKKGPDGLATYRREKNRLSIQGLPGLRQA